MHNSARARSKSLSIKAERRFVYVWLMEKGLFSVSFRGDLVAACDFLPEASWESIERLKTFGDATYLLLVGSPPYSKIGKAEVWWVPELGCPEKASFAFMRACEDTIQTARLIEKLIFGLSGGLGGI